jgi:L-aspartate oxidase
MTSPRRSYETIVVGSGISGLFVALEARKFGPVLVLTKGSIDDCNTTWAQGGIAAAVGPLDSIEAHLADTIAAGAGLVDESASRVLCSEAPARIRDLMEYGVRFDSLSGETALGREAAHSFNRILHAGGDRTGAAIETALTEQLQHPSITVLDHALVSGLTVDGAGRATGVTAINLLDDSHEEFAAARVVLATGGAGHLFSHTTNPGVATGDGIMLAFEAGAEVMDLEFYQFHPTALRLGGQPPFLISEAVRGEGATLLNAAGERFMPHYHADAELAPRDVVARAIVAEMESAGAGSVLLDCTAIDGVDLASRFPGIYAFCRDAGLDIARQPIPVAPAAHYFMGGIRTDEDGRTTVPGLYAVGEVACTGVHGANRLASNSLMETVVFGKRAVESFRRPPKGHTTDPRATSIAVRGRDIQRAGLQGLLWSNVGIQRDAASLSAAMATIEGFPAGDDARKQGTRTGLEDVQMSKLGWLMARAALNREESRGAHYRRDFPDVTESWRRHQVWSRAD